MCSFLWPWPRDPDLGCPDTWNLTDVGAPYVDNGRNFSDGGSWLVLVVACVTPFAINAVAQRSASLAVAMLCGFGLSLAPTLSYYAKTDPAVLWQTRAGTALFVGGFGAAGCNAPRFVRSCALLLLGAGRADRVRRRVDLCGDPWRFGHLFASGPGDLRGFDGLRLSATASKQGHQRGAPACGVDLLRHLERLPVLSRAVRWRRREADQASSAVSAWTATATVERRPSCVGV